MKITPFCLCVMFLSPTKALVWFVNPRISRDQQIGEHWQGPFWRNSICGARMPWIHLDLLLRRRGACSSPPSPVLRAITIFTPGQPCLALLSCPCRRPKPRALLLPGLALSRVIVSPGLKYSGKTGCRQSERATVLTLPAYSRLFPRGKRTLQQLPLFTRAREP